MCFSATASFTATAFLIPTGIYACKLAIQKDSRYLPFALTPCLFGIQQGLEGIEWLSLTHHQANLAQFAALGFLFFSHWLWLTWMGFSVLMMTEQIKIKTIILGITVLGFLSGASIYLPILFSPERFSATVTHGSINYQILYDQTFPGVLSHLIYLLIVVGPLWLSPSLELKIFGGGLTLALIATYGFYNYAFVSVWCFFAAILSVGIVSILRSPSFSPNLFSVGNEEEINHQCRNQ